VKPVEQGRALDRRFYGVVEAIVVDNVDPDREGRVRVRFPWYDDATVTEWARVRQLYAGPGYGAFFVPEKDDEVLVAFIHGDMRLPIILGGLYNGKDKPPSDRQADAVKNQKVIRTKAGHVFLLDDTEGKEKAELVTQGGHAVTLDDAGGTITVRSAGGQSIVLDAGGGSITLHALRITVAGDVSIELGSAPTDRVVLGDRLMALFNAHVHELGTATTGPPTVVMTGAELSAVARVG
jgi:uncharacterized protein involved in type VI secretion and phage assembly